MVFSVSHFETYKALVLDKEAKKPSFQKKKKDEKNTSFLTFKDR
ncbi:MAG: hypothetical protein ACR2M7_01520 [Bdellovibrionales bacterium]